MQATVNDSDEGKDVVQDGETIGAVIEVDHGTAYVDPDPDISDQLLSTLGWADRDDETYPLQEAAVAEVTDDEIRLRPSS